MVFVIGVVTVTDNCPLAIGVGHPTVTESDRTVIGIGGPTASTTFGTLILVGDTAIPPMPPPNTVLNSIVVPAGMIFSFLSVTFTSTFTVPPAGHASGGGVIDPLISTPLMKMFALLPENVKNF